MRAHLIVSATCACMLACMAHPGQAQSQWGRGWEHHGPCRGALPLSEYPQGLDLSKEKVAQFSRLRAGFLEEAAPLRSQLIAKQTDLVRLMLEEKPDAQKAEQLQAEVSDLQAKLANKRLQHELAFRAIMSSEQKAMLPPGCGAGPGPLQFGGGFRGCCGLGGGRGLCGW